MVPISGKSVQFKLLKFNVTATQRQIQAPSWQNWRYESHDAIVHELNPLCNFVLNEYTPFETTDWTFDKRTVVFLPTVTQLNWYMLKVAKLKSMLCASKSTFHDDIITLFAHVFSNRIICYGQGRCLKRFSNLTGLVYWKVLLLVSVQYWSPRVKNSLCPSSRIKVNHYISMSKIVAYVLFHSFKWLAWTRDRVTVTLLVMN